jgi:D-arabinose 1-dehydrogenase-like Zn-dependent alcohol dehydrogenase
MAMPWRQCSAVWRHAAFGGDRRGRPHPGESDSPHHGERSVKGWYSGASIDSQDTLKFSNATGVQSMNEIYRWTEPRSLRRMMSGKARFRVVLDVAGKS